MALSRQVLGLAPELALKSDCNKNHVAFISKGGKILSRGVNTNRTKIGNRITCCTHAEVAAVHNLECLLCSSKVD